LRQKAARLLHEVGLDEAHLARRVTELSGGQQQRVGIARAFMLDPAVVLADEPVASLDPKTSRDILSLIKQASQLHGATVLCTLHQIELAREFADRIVALRGGEIVFDGAPGEIDAATLNQVFGTHRPRPAADRPTAPMLPETSPA
jgi:phosphonate transport system ATP-binding protein